MLQVAAEWCGRKSAPKFAGIPGSLPRCAFYWFDVEKFLENSEDTFADAVPLFLPRDSVQDIDTLEDWKVSEQLYC